MAASSEFPDAVCLWWIHSFYWNILIVFCGISCLFLTSACVTSVSYRIVLRAYRDMYHSLCIGDILVCQCIVSALVSHVLIESSGHKRLLEITDIKNKFHTKCVSLWSALWLLIDGPAPLRTVVTKFMSLVYIRLSLELLQLEVQWDFVWFGWPFWMLCSSWYTIYFTCGLNFKFIFKLKCANPYCWKDGNWGFFFFFRVGGFSKLPVMCYNGGYLL